MKILEVNHFSIELRQDTSWRKILHYVSFFIEKGKTLGIVGESGSGKSITALSIMQLIKKENSKITHGNITFFDGEREQQLDVSQLKTVELEKIRGNKIAMIFQEPMTSLNPVIRCGEQVMEALRLHTDLTEKECKERVIELFNEVMLPRPEKIFNAYPHEISGGQKQRVMIAMAMSCNPDLLIADEPTTALDVTIQKGIIELLRDLQKKRQLSIIFISHDLGVISQIADHVLVLYKGKVVEQNKATILLTNPEHPYTKGLISCRPPLDCRLKYLPTIADFVDGNMTVEKVQNELLLHPKTREEEHKIIYSKEPIIKIKNITKIFPLRKEKLFEKTQYIKVLDEINLDIYEGETLGLVGESGCGKTTLGRTILQLIPPTSGSIYYKDECISDKSRGQFRPYRKDLQIILQDPYSSLNQKITIGEMLIEPMRIHKIYDNEKQRKQRAIELLERVGLAEEHLYRYAHEFSGGQRQRISIARALTVNPKFIVCDESVSALDVSVQAQVLNLLNDLKKEFQLTYLFISHDLSVVKFMSDRMAVMQNGKIVEINEADAVYANPQTEYCQNLISAIF